MLRITTNKLKKIEDVIGQTYDNGKLPKNMTLYEFRLLETCFEYLTNKEKYTTISLSVKNFFEQNKIPIKTQGIGWIIG